MKRDLCVVSLAAGLSLAGRFVAATRLEVFQDEALYWWGAQARPLSFSPHPPAAYLMVRLGTMVFGNTLLGLRAGSLVWGTAAIVLAYALGRDLYGARAGVWAAGFMAASPIFAAAGAATTPDGLLTALWLLFVWATWRSAAGGGAGWWGLGALALAAGLYTKYMMVLAPPALLLALCGSPQGRRALRTPGPWAALAVGVSLFAAQFLRWNVAHGWASLRYHLESRHAWSLSWKSGGQYVLGHLGALSPLLCALVIGALVCEARAWRRGNPRAAWVLAFGAMPILFFLPPSVFTASSLLRVQWDLVGYAVGTIAAGALMAGWGQGPPGRRWLRPLGIGALALAGMLTGATLVGLVYPTATEALGIRPLTLRRLGWRQLAARVQDVKRETAADFVVTDSFRTALSLGYYSGQRDGIYTLLDSASKRYGLNEALRSWRMDESHMVKERLGQSGLYVEEHTCVRRCNCGQEPERIGQFFRQVSRVEALPVFLEERVLRCFRIYRVVELRPNVQP